MLPNRSLKVLMIAESLSMSASPLGIMLASPVNYQIAGVWFADDPAQSWRYVFLCGLAPVLLALAPG